MILTVFLFNFQTMIAGILEVIIAILMLSLEVPNMIPNIQFFSFLRKFQEKIFEYNYYVHGLFYVFVIQPPILLSTNWMCVICYFAGLIAGFLYIAMSFKHPWVDFSVDLTSFFDRLCFRKPTVVHVTVEQAPSTTIYMWLLDF